MLFLDPESLIYYRKIIGRDDFIRLEPLDDTLVSNGRKDQGSRSSSRPGSTINKSQSENLGVSTS